jgi:hypothetical protein
MCRDQVLVDAGDNRTLSTFVQPLAPVGDSGEIMTGTVIKGLIERDTGGHLALTDRGQAVLRAMLPDL